MSRSLTIGLLLSLTTLISAPAEAETCVDPRLLVLFDSSGSLGSKKNAASNYNAAVDAVLGVTASEDDHIAFGMLLFPSDPDAMQCQMSTGLAVPFGVGNHATFQAFFEGYEGPHGKSDTPMLQALKAVHDAPPSQTGIGGVKMEGAAGYVVLVTDGIQDCCADELLGTGFGWDTEPDCNQGEPFGSANYYNQAEVAANRDEQIQIVKNLSVQEIPTFVVGFGAKVDPVALNDMAVAGGTPRVPGCGVDAPVGPCYYQANSATELAIALADVAAQVGQELCNDQDDDCDGLVDEDLTKQCVAACGTGTQVCKNGVWSACPIQQPEPETCDGEDNNCDGNVDEWLIQDCSTPCGIGTEVCEDGEWVGCTAKQPGVETCNGKDDDCNGSTDEGCGCAEGATEVCGLAIGECEPGTKVCVGGVWSDCTGGKGPTTEICNAKDDDCDGNVDGMEQTCATPCGTGTETCIEGSFAGCTAPPAQAEQCNGEDDDCDGEVDEELVQDCETDCAVGTEHCTDGQWRDCTASLPTAEKCDGKDNDCDGEVDEGTTIPCATDCGSGERSCDGGVPGECIVQAPAAEACDGLDNDCNGITDDGATCPGDLVCLCGGCATPSKGGSCEYGTEYDGFCVIDLCPGGKYCADGVCEEGEAPPPVDEADISGGGDVSAVEAEGGDAGDTSFQAGGGDASDPTPLTVADGCDCDQAAPLGRDTTFGSGLVWLLVAAVTFGRRKARG